MTTLDPSLASFDHPDRLGGALQQGLPRPMNPKLSWGFIRTFLLGGITGGIVPAIVLPKRFNNFAKAEQLQFWHLAEWLRLQTGDTEAAAATEAAKRVTPGIALRLMSLAFVIVAIGIACTAIPHNGPVVPRWFALTLPDLEFPLPNLASGLHESIVREHAWDEDRSGPHFRHASERYSSDESTGKWFRIYHPGSDAPIQSDPNFGDGAPNGIHDTTASISQLVASDLVNAFALAMGGAGLCWLIEVNTHIGRVRRFVGAFNQLSHHYGVGPVRPPGLHLGLGPLWILGAAATCALGGFWAVPVMLAAGAHRRYIRTTSARLRSDLARRQREVLLAKRPAIRVPASAYLMGTCPRDNCRAPTPPEAVFCRRCGTKLALV